MPDMGTSPSRPFMLHENITSKVLPSLIGHQSLRLISPYCNAQNIRSIRPSNTRVAACLMTRFHCETCRSNRTIPCDLASADCEHSEFCCSATRWALYTFDMDFSPIVGHSVWLQRDLKWKIGALFVPPVTISECDWLAIQLKMASSTILF
jgi:hypothetical protein